MAVRAINRGFSVTGVVIIVVVTAFMLTRCGEPAKTDPASKFEDVTIDGKKFHLELALEDAVRFKGLSDRAAIPADGGMLFVFPRPMTTAFVMRDCPVPIDIIYLDANGRVLTSYKMTAEPPRAEDEKVQAGETVNRKYEDRLKKYPSEFDAQFVIELKGDTLDTLSIKKNEKINLDLPGLKKRAR